MFNQLRTRHILAFVVFCVLLSVGLLFIHTRRRTSHSVPPEQESKVTITQEVTSAKGIPAGGPSQGTLDGQRPTEVGVKRLPVSAPPSPLSPSQLPPRMPAASQLPSEAEQEKAWQQQEGEWIKNLTAGMDAFTAAKYLYDNHYRAKTEPYIRRFAAQALAENPNHFDTLLLWTDLLPRKSYAYNPEQEAGYRKLLEMDPNSVSALVGLADAMYWVQPEEAIEHLEKAKLQDPGLANAYLGFAYQRVGDYDKALEILKARPENDIVAQAHLHGIESGEPYIPPIQRAVSPPQEHSEEDGAFMDVPLNTDSGFSTETETPHSAPPKVRTQDTSGGLSDAEIEHLFDNMTDAQLETLDRFLRDEFPEEYAKFLDAESEISAGRNREDIEAEFTPHEFRDAYQLLEKYGPEEGMERLRKASPRLARKIVRELNKRKAASRRHRSGESKPQPTTPPED